MVPCRVNPGGFHGRRSPKQATTRYPRALTNLEAAWAAVHENTPEGWYVGQPMEHPERAEWSMYAFDPAEQTIVGKRSREWPAVGQTELHCVQTMAYCLGELKEGRWPE